MPFFRKKNKEKKKENAHVCFKSMDWPESFGNWPKSFGNWSVYFANWPVYFGNWPESFGKRWISLDFKRPMCHFFQRIEIAIFLASTRFNF